MKSIITLLLNDRKCNFNCEYCYARNEHTGQHKAEPMTDFSAIDFLYERKIEKAREQGDTVQFETTFWGGEPLFNPHLKNLVKYLKDKYGSTFFFVTNGSLIDDEWADWMIENHVRILISNDLKHQSMRGWQYMDDDKHSKAIAKVANADLVGCIQSVYSRINNDPMGNLGYLRDWEKRYGVEKPIMLGILAMKDYDGNMKEGLLAGLDDAMTESYVKNLYEYSLYALQHHDEDAYRRFCKESLMNAERGLKNRPMDEFIKEDGRRKHTNCSVFRDGCYDLYGRHWNCPHYFEKDPENPVIIEPHESEMCLKCLYYGECNGICESADERARIMSCESLKAHYRTIRQAVYDITPEEERKNYVSEAVQDLWYN